MTRYPPPTLLGNPPSARWLVAVISALLLSGCQPVQRADDEVNLIAKIYVTQGQMFTESGELDEAIRRFDMALEYNPRMIEARIGLGDVHEIRGDPAKAAEQYAEARKIDPRNFKATYKLALMYQLLNRVRESINLYLEALTIDPYNFDANHNLATAYLQTGQPQLGVVYAEEAVNLKPASQEAHANLGSVYSALGESESAVKAYKSALELGDAAAPIEINLATALVKAGKAEEARQRLLQLVETDPRYDYWERLGYASFKLGLYQESLRAYVRGLKIKPEDPPCLNGIGVNLMTIYIGTERKDIRLRNRAIEYWRRSIKSDPKQPRIIDLVSRYRKL